MASHHGHRVFGPAKIVIITFGALLLSSEALAEARLSGRLFLTYQKTGTPQLREEFFIGRFDTVLRDRFLDTHDLKISFILDNSKNLSRDQTLRRYRLQLEASHRLYDFNALFSPKQKQTPLELATEDSREFTEQQYILTLHMPKYPQLRLLYARAKRYERGRFANFQRELRADLRYRYRNLDLSLKKYDIRNQNSTANKTAVTGGGARYSRSLWRYYSVSAGYEYLLTEAFRGESGSGSVANHTASALMTGRHKNIVSGSLSLITRRLNTENHESTSSRNDNYSFLLNFLPRSPVQFKFSRNYILSEQPTGKMISDYATAQIVASGKVRKGTTGRAQVSRRIIIRDVDGVIPANLYFFSLRSAVSDGADVHATFNVSQLDRNPVDADRYQIISEVNIFLEPRERLTIKPNFRLVRHSDEFSLLRNDRRTIGLTATYFARRRWNSTLDIRHIEVTQGRQRKDFSAVLSFFATLRQRTTFNVSYGINNVDELSETLPGQPNPDTRGTTLNVQGQTYMRGNSYITVNYLRTDQDNAGDNARASDYLNLTYHVSF